MGVRVYALICLWKTQDELLWAAAWLQRANQDQTAMDYLDESGTTGDVRTMFSWDDKFVGVQILVAKV